MSTANTHAGGTQSKIKIDQMLRKLQQRNSTHLAAIFLLVKQFAIHHHQLFSFTSYAVLFISVYWSISSISVALLLLGPLMLVFFFYGIFFLDGISFLDGAVFFLDGVSFFGGISFLGDVSFIESTCSSISVVFAAGENNDSLESGPFDTEEQAFSPSFYNTSAGLSLTAQL